MTKKKPSVEKTMEYNGYIGTVEYSAEDELLYGKIWGINDGVTYDGESISQLKEAFHEAVDEYVTICKEMGKDPQKTYKGVFNVRVKPKLHKKAALEATKRGMSLNQFVEMSISHELVSSDQSSHGKTKEREDSTTY